MAPELDGGDFEQFKDRLLSSGNKKELGTFFDQRFYALRYFPGADITFPFEPKHFNALVHISVDKVEKETLKKIALEMLKHGLRMAICSGTDAAVMGSLIDELVDEYGFNPDDRTVFTSIHEGEELEETLEYFMLPSGLAETSLIFIVGDDSDYDEITDLFDNICGQNACECGDLTEEYELCF